MSNRAVHILSAPVNSGKTTRLQQWCAGRNDVAGILTPRVKDRRVFEICPGGEQFDMEASAGEEEILSVGKYVFSKAAFNKAIKVIDDALSAETGWMVIDEIGPLELQGKGFHDILKKILATPGDECLLIVVRDGLVERVVEYFGITPRHVDSTLLPG